MENPFEEKQNLRPTFLTVLCILTFIGSGWGLLSSLFSLFTAGITSVQMEQYSAMMDGMQNEANSSFLSGFFSSSAELLQATVLYAKQIATWNLVLYVVSLIGAILMFRLNRIGFYLYVAAQVVMLFVLPFYAGFSLLVISSIVVSAVFAVLFIVLYALNLKYMK